MSPITAGEFDDLSRLIDSLTGIRLDASKKYLVETRLGPLLRESGCGSYGELCAKARVDRNAPLARRIIDAITTGETSFFRDGSPFDLLRHKIVPDLIDARTRNALPGAPVRIRVWSMACSTGQEVYSVGILLRDLLPGTGRYDIRILGTDISDAAVARAAKGCYTRMEIDRGMPATSVERHFVRQGDRFRVGDEVRAMAAFRRLNLLEDFAHVGEFDIVLCRNVAIYFSEEEKVRLFRRIVRNLSPDGYLLVGATESLAGLCPWFEAKRHLRAVYYQVRQEP